MAEPERQGSDSDGAVRKLLGASVSVLMSPARFVTWMADWLHYWTRSRRRIVTLVVLVGCLAVGAAFSRVARLDLRFAEAKVASANDAETFYIPPPETLRFAALGHRPFLADMLFIRANLYFATHLLGDRIFEWLDTYAEAILALDPDYARVYEWASQSTKYGQMVTKEILARANAYSERGIERFPDYWRFYLDIGFNYFVEWPSDTPEEREAMKRKARPYFAVASALPGSTLDPNFVAELYLHDDDIEMALFHAYLNYWEASEGEREQLRRRITRFESTAAAERLARTEGRWKDELPYVPIGLFELLERDGGPGLPGSWADDTAFEAAY